MTTIDNSRYLTTPNSDKTDPSHIIQDLAGDKGQIACRERKLIHFKGIEKILQNEENRLIQNDTIKNLNNNIQ